MRARLWCGFVLAALGLGAALDASAGTVSYPAPNTGRVAAAPINGSASSDLQRLLSKNVSTGGLNVTDSVLNPKAGGTPIPGMQNLRTVPAGKVLRSAARIVGPIGNAVALAELLDLLKCHYDGGMKCDEGQDEETKQVNVYYGMAMGSTCAALFPSAYSAAMACHQQKTGQVPTSMTPIGANAWTCHWNYQGNANDPRATTCSGVPAGTQTITQCPQYTDRNGQMVGPGSAPMANGRCQNGVMIPPDLDELADDLEEYGDPSKVVDIGREVMERGVDLTPDAGPQVLSGPASVSGGQETTTTTSPGGTPETTTTTTTHNITYNSTVNNFTWVTITNITHPDGTTETTEEKPEEPPPSECELNPEAVQCKELDAPDGPDMDDEEIEVEYQPDSGWGADDAQCPANKTVTVLGQPVLIDLTLVCEFVSGIRFAIIGMAGLIGAMIFVGGLRQ